MAFQLNSSAFKSGSPIPTQYTCDGKNISPPIHWQDAPVDTKSFVLINEDPDAHPVWLHWLVYNIPAKTIQFVENVPKNEKLADGSHQCVNDFTQIGYGGPCPPSGTHRYFFKLFALDTLLALPAKPTKQQVESAMKGHVLAETELMGTYIRKR